MKIRKMVKKVLTKKAKKELKVWQRMVKNTKKLSSQAKSRQGVDGLGWAGPGLARRGKARSHL